MTTAKPSRSKWAAAARALAAKQRAALPPMPDAKREPVRFAAWVRANAMSFSQMYARWPEARALYGPRLTHARARLDSAGRTNREVLAKHVYSLVKDQVQDGRPRWTALAAWLGHKHRLPLTPNQLRMIVRSRVGTT